MLALRCTPPDFGIAGAERVAQDVYGLSLTLRPLSGERDCNFHAQSATGVDYVLKIMHFADLESAQCQVLALKHLEEQDPTLAVPRPHGALDGADVGCFERNGVRFCTCLLSYLPGELLAECRPGRYQLGSLGHTLARLDGALRGFFHPALARHLAWDVRRLPELQEFLRCIPASDLRHQVRRVIGALRERLPALRGLPAQAVHGDCHAGNVLIDQAVDAVCGVLDFGDMIHAPRILEPAVAMSELLTEGLVEDPEDLSALLEGYAHTARLDVAEIELLYDLITARHASTLLVHAWRREYHPPGAAVLDQAALRATASLDRMLRLGPETLTRGWHRAAGTGESGYASIDLGRRQRLLGAGAALFYDVPLHLVRGEGVWLYDPAGHAYLDAYNNVPHVGHCHPVVVAAIQRQTAVLSTHTRYLHERVLEYAERLLARCPPHLDTCIFVNSGSEANDVAWRIAELATGHAGALIMANAYHGITHAVAALTPGAGQPQELHVVTLAPPPEGLQAHDTMTPAALTAAVADADRAVQTLAARGLSPAAFFLDTAITSSGIYDPPPAWAEAVTSRIRAAGGLIVADEVQYGLGRSGSHFWGYERRGIVPDLITLGKPVGNGYPMGAVIASRRMVEAFQQQCGFFSTFGGNPVAASAGLAVLEVIQRERLQENAATTGDYLRQGLERLAAGFQCLGAVRGSGLLLGLDIGGDDADMAQRRTREIVNHLASKSRILIGSEGPAATILKLRPPLAFRPEHADLLVAAIGAAAARVDFDR